MRNKTVRKARPASVDMTRTAPYCQGTGQIANMSAYYGSYQNVYQPIWQTTQQAYKPAQQPTYNQQQYLNNYQQLYY